MKHIDDKWPAYDYEKYRRGGAYGMRKYSDGSKYEQAMVDMDAYMALDDEMKKKYIVLDPSVEPFKLHHLTGLDHFVPSKDSTDFTVMPLNMPSGFFRGQRGGKRGGGRYNHNNNSGYYHNSGFHHREQQNSFAQQQQQQQPPPPAQMTYVSDIERDVSTQYNEPQDQQEPVMFQQPQHNEPYVFESSQHQQAQAPQTVFHPISASQVPWNNHMIPFMQPQYQVHGQPFQFTAPVNYQNIMPYGNFSIPPPVASGTSDSSATDGDAMKILREAELSSTTIDWKAKESSDQAGADMPMSDMPTLRFYYNLGIRYFLATGVKNRLESVVNELEVLNLNEAVATDEKVNESAKVEQPPPVPTNTPVTTKPVYGPPGRTFGNNPHNSGRRPFTVNRDNNQRDSRDWNTMNNSRKDNGNWNNSRKDFKFNSNVKNVHKANQKPSGNGNGFGANNGSSKPAAAGVQSQTYYGTGVGSAAAQPATSSVISQEKISPSSMNSATQYSPISPIAQETPQVQYQQPPMQQEYPSYQQQQQQVQPFYQYGGGIQPQQNVVMVVQNDDGSIHPVQSMTPSVYRKFLFPKFFDV